jgi:uncharacterized protein Yka (UPF0111/DUF47 family)
MKKVISDFQKLKDYALWYYFKYFPSNERLFNKLLEKTNKNKDLVKDVYDNIKHLFREEDIIRDKINNYLFRNKNLNYIKQKLFIKKFPKNIYEEILKNDFIKE